MPTSYWIPLTNSQGLARLIFFTGLGRPMVVLPVIKDKALLTAQPYYFLSLQECVAKVQFTDKETQAFISERQREGYLEELADNYFFRYSRLHPRDAVTAKPLALSLMPDMDWPNHFTFDYHRTLCLALDPWNDQDIVDFNIDGMGKGEFGDYVLMRELIEPQRQAYLSAIKAALTKRVILEAKSHPEFGDGTHELPIVILKEMPLTAEDLDTIEIVDPDERRDRAATHITLSRTPSDNGIRIKK